MPRVVNHEERRRVIADALLAVAAERGIAAVSVRTVAARAGLSVGSMRHTAASQDELVAFAMRSVAERAVGRLAARLGAGPSDVDGLSDVCAELLPLDDERRVEAAVWFELVALARSGGPLQQVSVETHEGIAQVVGHVVGELLGPEADAEVRGRAAAHLHALLDGLALHEVLYPGSRDPDTVRALVRDHLRTLDRSRPRSRPRTRRGEVPSAAGGEVRGAAGG